MDYGKYDETARYFRRMNELAEQLAAAEPGALEPRKVMASVKATLAGFQMDQIGDAQRRSAIRPGPRPPARMAVREPSDDNAKRGVANILGAIARAQLQLGNPAAARERYREEIDLRDHLSPAPAISSMSAANAPGWKKSSAPSTSRSATRRPAASVSSRRSGSAGRTPPVTPRRPRRSATCWCRSRSSAHHELIDSRDPVLARRHYQEVLDGFLERLNAEPASVLAKFSVALAHYYVATAALRAGDREAAAAHYRACRDIRVELAKDPKTKLNSMDLMLALARTGDHEKASQIAESMIKVPPLDARIYFHAACGFALSAGAAASLPPSALSARLVRHYTDRALDALRLALKRGWRSAEEVATDPDLDPIRADPEFIAVLEQFRKAGP